MIDFNEKESILTQMYWKLYSMFVYPIRNFIYKLKGIPRGLRNLVYFSKVVYQYRSYDYGYLYAFLLKALEKNVDYFKDPKNVHVVNKERNLIYKDLCRAYKALKTIKNQDYIDLEYELLGVKYPHKTVFIKESDETSVMKTVFLRDEDAKIYSKEVHKLWCKESRLHRKAWDDFLKAFKKSESWWT